MPARCLCSALLAPLALACFEPPELDEVPPPPPDLGAVDTWAALDPAVPPAGDEGPPEDSGPDSGPGSGPDSGDDASGDGASIDPALAQLLISEVLVDPAGKDGGPDSPEFIELWNPGPSPAKLEGLRVDAASWPLLDADELGLADRELGVGALLLIHRWASDGDPALAEVQDDGMVILTGFLHSGGLRNKDGSVTIAAGSTSIDQLVYGLDPARPTPGWPGAAVPAPGSDISMCRSSSKDHDDASDWASCTPDPGALDAGDSPDEIDSSPPSIAFGAVQIVEVAANPPGPSSDEKPYEYVEIINISENQVELSGSRIGDALEPDAPGVDPLEYVGGEGGCESLTCLAPGRRALIVGQGYLGETGEALILATDDSTLADGGLTNTEPVVLWDAGATLVSSYRLWPDPTLDPLPSEEQPLHRVDPVVADEPASWIVAPASPGL